MRGNSKASPIDSHVTPIPWDMPGYDSQVIMAAGTFVSGASIELSADGPMKEPYAVYFQEVLHIHMPNMELSCPCSEWQKKVW